MELSRQAFIKLLSLTSSPYFETDFANSLAQILLTVILKF